MVTATSAPAVDTEVGRVVPVTVNISDTAGTVLAVLEERFAIRGRTGTAALHRPGTGRRSVSENATETRAADAATSPSPRRSACGRSPWCPAHHNPIHTDTTAALLAGLESPIVHGMWLGRGPARRDRHRR